MTLSRSLTRARSRALGRMTVVAGYGEETWSAMTALAVAVAVVVGLVSVAIAGTAVDRVVAVVGSAFEHP